jgi:tetratricopeptide (TPR) repeat protein
MNGSLRRIEPAAGGAWKLRIETGGHTWEHALAEERIVVGRAEDCTIILEDERVSKRHFEIHREGEDWLLTDLGSRNGTRINGQVLSDTVLRPGDRIELGRTTLEVLVEKSAPEPKPPARPAEPEARAGQRSRSSASGRALTESDPQASREEPPRAPLPRPAPAPRAEESKAEEERPEPARDARPPSDGPRRVEVLLKSAVPYASSVEAKHGERRLRLPLYAGIAGLLGLLVLAFSAAHKQGGTEDNPLARIHSNEGAPQEDLLQRKGEQEAAQLRESLLARAKAALEGQSAEAIARTEDASALDAARGKLREAEAALARVVSATPADTASKELLERTRAWIGQVDARAAELKKRAEQRVAALVARARSLVSAGRLDEAEAAVRELSALDPKNAEARKLASEISTRRSASAEEARRLMRLRKLGDEVEQSYRAGVDAAELGNGAQALSAWAQAEDAFERLQGEPRAQSSEELKKAEGFIADIQTRKAALKPKADASEQEAERLLGKARLYEDLGQLDKARELWQKVLEVVPNPEHRYHKMALRKLGQKP